MTTTYSVIVPSGSTNGQPIQINATTSGAATTLHTAVTGTSSFDEQYWWLANISNGAITATVLLGGTTTSNAIPVTVPALAGKYLVVAGVRLNNALVTAAYVSSGNQGFVTAIGNVNRIV